MAWFYADSSVLVKRHVIETGSAWVVALFTHASGHAIVTSRLSNIEVISALNRRMREGTLTATDYSGSVIWFSRSSVYMKTV